MRQLTKAGIALSALGAAGIAYAAGYEVRAYTLRHVDIPMLPRDARPLRVLHLSDLHLTPGQRKKQEWVRSLGDLEPDLVVNTGDNLGHLDAVPFVLDALAPLLDRPGVFVFGSNDYYSPIVKNPARYLWAPSDLSRRGRPMPWSELRHAFAHRGWTDLTNRRERVKAGEMTLAFAGVDDPHLGYDDLDAVGGTADSDADLRMAVTHAPYLRVLDAFTRDGHDLTFAGHTHGGQLRLPFAGALVTNCDLDTARAKGLHSHAADGRTSRLHVSAGLGTSPYAPVRFCCRPEASLVTLLPVS